MSTPLSLLFISLFCLGAGYFLRTPRQKGEKNKSSALAPDGVPERARTGLKLSASGWILFGTYWLLQAPSYYETRDIVNTVFAVGALPFFGKIAHTELKSTGWGLTGLRFLAGLTVITMSAYVLVNEIPAVEGELEYLNAYLVSGYLTALGFPSEAGPIDYAGNPLWHRANDLYISSAILHNGRDDILISLACTAFPSLMLFTGAVFSASEGWKTKLKAFILIIPSIVVLNVVRMAMIAYLTYTGITSAVFAHNVLGKAGSLLALLLFAWVLFTFLPSVLDSIGEIMNIFLGPPAKGNRKGKRKKPEKRSGAQSQNRKESTGGR